MIYNRAPADPYEPVVIHPFLKDWAGDTAGNFSVASGSWGVASRAVFLPIRLYRPYTVAKAWVLNGATVGTDSWDIGIYQMTDMTTGRLDLIRSTGAVVSAGTVNLVQEASAWKVACTHITNGQDSTDGTAFTTASVTLKAGRLYLLSFTNTAASAAAASSISSGPTWSSRATTQFNGTAHRVSIWSGVPTVDYTGTLVINFGATQTGAKWSLDEFSGVDTATTDGVVQGVTGTGNSTTPLATLAAFGSANNATYGAMANTADSTTTPGAGFTELSDDTTAVTPAQFLETEWRVDNDTTVDGTITSGQWGAAAVEIKADAASFVIPPSLPGSPNIYMGMTMNGTTATVFRVSTTAGAAAAGGYLIATSVFPLPSNVTPVAPGTATTLPQFLAGFTSRSLIG
jgi:hypothetical protein